MEDGTARLTSCGNRLATSDHQASRPRFPRLGHDRQRSRPATAPSARRDSTYGRCAMAGRSASSDSSSRRSITRVPWGALGLVSSAVSSAAVASYSSHPLVGQAIGICETGVTMTIIATALFGSGTRSERAFRLLRWLSNRQEPDAPPIEATRACHQLRRRRSGIELPAFLPKT